MNDAIEHFHIIEDIEGEARLFSKMAIYYYCVRNCTKAQNFNHRAHSLALRCNSPVVQLEGLTGLAIIEIREGNWSEALQLAYETRRIAAAAGNVMDELVGTISQARCYMGLGDYKHAMQLVKEGKALIFRLGIQGGDSEITLINFEAELYRYKTKMLSHQTSPLLVPVDYGFTLVNIVYLDLVMGTSTESVSVNLQAAAAAFRSVHYPRGIEICELHTADLKLREGNKTSACTQYVRTFTGAYGMDDELTCHCLATLADFGNPVHAASEVARWAIVFLAYTMHKSSRSMLVVHQALRCFGDVLAQESMDDEALNVLTVALEGFTWMDVHQSRADCMQTMGDVHLRCGETLKACTFWTEARQLFERSSQAKAVSKIDSRLAKLTQQHKASLEQLSKLPAIPLQHSLAPLKK
ncbi:hypothetical protein B0H14DRAFT_2592779 [Mycena olivaceomarginata]|nr:hypothetical protein B0H14DRAFT_2592779 [Mycena olivaceomarginata]